MARPLGAIAGLLLTTTAARTGCQVTGTSYRVHVAQSVSHAPDTPDVSTTEWTAIVLWAAGRGRIDIVDGRQEGLFEKGDYVLFDSTDYITVHPATKSFVGSPPAVSDSARRTIASSGIVLKMDSVRTSSASLGASDAIEGHATQRYRVTLGFIVSADVRGALSRLHLDTLPPELATELVPSSPHVTMISEQWLARMPGLPQLPFGSRTGARADIPFVGEMAKKLSALQAIPPGTTALRSMAIITIHTPRKSAMDAAAAMNDSTVFRRDISDIHTSDVDLDRLVLPAEFVEQLTPEMSVLYPNGLPASLGRGAKWRVKPTR